MKTTIIAVATSLLMSGAVWAQDLRKDAVTGVINEQLQAFMADDFSQAFTYASPMIQSMFGNPDRFGMMVQQGYPMVWRPAKVVYGATRSEGDAVFQKVLITDQSGALHELEYEMIPRGEGWQINGVQVLRTPQLGA